MSAILRIAICDDMPEFLEETKQAILQWNHSTVRMHIDTYQDADVLISAHTARPFDIIFLDVVMPLVNGIEAARELRQNDSQVKIVFLTSSSEYAVDSYTVKADNYLLKPLNVDQLYQCLDDLYLHILLNAKSIIVRDSNSLRRLQLNNIEYLEAQNKQVYFKLVDGSFVISTNPLYSFEDDLLCSDGFFKCHRSYIVNMNQIETYTQKAITMRSGGLIPISRGCHKVLLLS